MDKNTILFIVLGVGIVGVLIFLATRRPLVAPAGPAGTPDVAIAGIEAGTSITESIIDAVSGNGGASGEVEAGSA